MSGIDLLALPFDQYQRYTAVAQIVDLVKAHLQRPSLRILDVGGFYRTRQGAGILPLTEFLPQDRVTSVDLVAEPVPRYILSTGQALPFADGAFDMVVSCDTLEHVPAADRLAFVGELLRVAIHYLVLIAPFDDEPVRLAECIVYDYLIGQGLGHIQLREHRDLGLPDADALRASLTERGLAFVDMADGYLPHWLIMMLIKHTPRFSLDFQLDLDRYYNRHFSPGDRREPAYRRAFVVALPGNEALLPVIASSLGSANEPPVGFDHAADLIRLLARGQNAAQAQALDAPESQLADVRAQMAFLESENERLHQLVTAYERGCFIRFMRWVHRWREKFGV